MCTNKGRPIEHNDELGHCSFVHLDGAPSIEMRLDTFGYCQRPVLSIGVSTTNNVIFVGFFAVNQLLLSNIFMCLASFCAYRLH